MPIDKHMSIVKTGYRRAFRKRFSVDYLLTGRSWSLGSRHPIGQLEVHVPLKRSCPGGQTHASLLGNGQNCGAEGLAQVAKQAGAPH